MLIVISITFIAALSLSLVLTPLAARTALRVGLVDRPSRHRAGGSRVVPRAGGYPLAIGVWGAIGVMALFSESTRRMLEHRPELLGALIAAGLVMFILGAIDDLRDLTPKLKLAVQLLVAAGVLAAGLGFDRITLLDLPMIHLGWLAAPITVMWIVGVTNAMNLIDGVDGLALTTTALISAAIGFIAYQQGNTGAAAMAAALTGSSFGVLRSNFAPAKVFLGDAGSLFAGSSLAVLSLGVSAKGAVAGSMLIPVLLLGYPILDTLLVMLRRWLSGKSILSGDQGHIHHRMLERGMKHSQITIVLAVFTMMLCYLGVCIAAGSAYLSTLGLILVGAFVFIGSRVLGYPSHLSVRKLRRWSPRFRAVRYQSRLACVDMELAGDLDGAFSVLQRVGKLYGVARFTILLPPGDADNGAARPAPRRRIVMSFDNATARLGARHAGWHHDVYRDAASGFAVRTLVPCDTVEREYQLECRIAVGRVLRAMARRLRDLDRSPGEATYDDNTDTTAGAATHTGKPGEAA
ncbi:MAG: hypothetical protein GC159_17115 [Phycisphaera sp.]|nr:hypothetical protein [Phycisphaera sp.]